MDINIESQLTTIFEGGDVVYDEISHLSLWAGYGWLKKLKVKKPEVRVIVHKFIDPVSSDGDSSSVGHKRKVASYRNEATFYAQLAPVLKNQHLSLPVCLHYGNLSGEVTSIFMEDLRQQYPIENLHGLNYEQTMAAVKWLAKLHALCWHKNYEKDMGLADEGCYWYLGTRMDEYESINEEEWGNLKTAATALSDRMKKGKSGAGWTIIHGDYKATNLMYSENFKNEYGDRLCRCAGIDFQYTGGGYGARDLAMLVVCGCKLDRDDMTSGIDMETEVLDLYYQCLCDEMSSRDDGNELMQSYSMSLLRGQYELALMDMVRFLSGWGMWGNSNYACERVKALLRTLDRGEPLNEEGYRDALARQYPYPHLNY